MTQQVYKLTVEFSDPVKALEILDNLVFDREYFIESSTRWLAKDGREVIAYYVLPSTPESLKQAKPIDAVPAGETDE